MNSLIKFGSLAFDVASDEKLRELLGMVHKGAKRRGFIGQPQTSTTQHGHGVPNHWPHMTHPIPFAPSMQETKKEEPKKAEEPAPKPKPKEQPQGPSFQLPANAQKILGWANTFNDLLNKK